MTRRISLALAIHNHQPVGNFGWVFAETYDQAYLPMLEALERHPGVHLSLHYTGPAPRVAAGRATGLHRSPAGARRLGTRSRSWAAATTSPCWPRCPKRDRVGQLTRMGDELESLFGRRPERRVARGARLGAGPAGLAGRRRVRVDDPRRRPLPGGGHPRGGPLGAVHDRGPGRDPDRLRDRAGPALPDPVPRRRGRHRLPPRPRHRGRVAGRDDGRRRREVRGVADDLRALLGREPLGGPVLHRPRGQRRLAVDGDAVGVAGPRATDRAGLHPDRLLRRDGPVGAARGREPPVHRAPASRRGRAPARGALAARRVLAQLPGQVPRDQRPPQADAADVGGGRRDGAPARLATRRSTTSTRASPTTATGTACSAASTSATCASRRTST